MNFDGVTGTKTMYLRSLFDGFILCEKNTTSALGEFICPSGARTFLIGFSCRSFKSWKFSILHCMVIKDRHNGSTNASDIVPCCGSLKTSPEVVASSKSPCHSSRKLMTNLISYNPSCMTCLYGHLGNMLECLYVAFTLSQTGLEVVKDYPRDCCSILRCCICRTTSRRLKRNLGHSIDLIPQIRSHQ